MMNRATYKLLLADYADALLQAPQLLHRLAFRTRNLEDELQEARAGVGVGWRRDRLLRATRRGGAALLWAGARPSPLRALTPAGRVPDRPLQALLRGNLQKAFGGYDLLLLGLGIVIGSGWAQLTGYAAVAVAG